MDNVCVVFWCSSMVLLQEFIKVSGDASHKIQAVIDLLRGADSSISTRRSRFFPGGNLVHSASERTERWYEPPCTARRGQNFVGIFEGSHLGDAATRSEATPFHDGTQESSNEDAHWAEFGNDPYSSFDSTVIVGMFHLLNWI